MKLRYATVVFDADSTLSAIEGIDWLAQQRGPALGEEVARLTTRAMAGELPLEAVYEARLKLIQPTVADITALSDAYVAAMEPGATELIAQLKAAGVRVIILSGGLRPALLPMAHKLDIIESDVHAVDLEFDSNGAFVGLRGSRLLTQQTGKPQVVQQLALPTPLAMIGDGSTDAAVAPIASAFIAYTGVVRRDAVVAVATAQADSYSALRPLLFADG